MITWSNHDRAALNEWLNSDLGQKFLLYMRESRPKFDNVIPTDINAMAMWGAILRGYETAIEQIDKMRSISAPKAVEPRPYVKDTHKD